MKPKIRIEIDASISATLRQMQKVLTEEALVPIMKKRLWPLARDMRSRVRRRTGKLARSITVSQKLSPAQAAAHVPIAPVEMFVGAGPLPQAVQEEWGNFRELPHPFVAPVFDERAEGAANAIARDGMLLVKRTIKG